MKGTWTLRMVVCIAGISAFAWGQCVLGIEEHPCGGPTTLCAASCVQTAAECESVEQRISQRSRVNCVDGFGMDECDDRETPKTSCFWLQQCTFDNQAPCETPGYFKCKPTGDIWNYNWFTHSGHSC